MGIKVRGSQKCITVKLDVHSSEWDDKYSLCDIRMRYCNRKFSKIKRSKMLKLVHNLQCQKVISQCYWIPLAKIALKGPFLRG